MDYRDSPDEAQFRARLRAWLADNELDDALDALELPDTAAGNIDAPRAFAEVTDDDDVVEVGDMDDVDLLDDDGEGASPTDPPPRSSTVPPPLSKHKA